MPPNPVQGIGKDKGKNREGDPQSKRTKANVPQQQTTKHTSSSSTTSRKRKNDESADPPPKIGKADVPQQQSQSVQPKSIVYATKHRSADVPQQQTTKHTSSKTQQWMEVVADRTWHFFTRRTFNNRPTTT